MRTVLRFARRKLNGRNEGVLLGGLKPIDHQAKKAGDDPAGLQPWACSRRQEGPHKQARDACTMSIDLHTEALLQRFEDFAADLDERAADEERSPLTYDEVTKTITRYINDYRFYDEANGE